MNPPCTTELALRSTPADFDLGRATLDLRARGIEGVGDAFLGVAGRGWAGIEGQYAAGLEFLAEVIGTQVVEYSERAAGAAEVYDAAHDRLLELRAESEILLVEAQATQRALDSAALSQEASQRRVVFWKREKDHADTPDEASRAESLFWHHVGEREEHKSAVRLAGLQLGNMQRRFERIRTDEDDAHQEFANGLAALEMTDTEVSVSPSGAVESLGDLLDLFDAAAVGYFGVDGRFGRRTRQTIDVARRFLADAADIDLDERDERLRRLEEQRRLADARRQLDELGAEELRRLLDQAFRRGDLREVDRLMSLLFDGTTTMSDGERMEFVQTVLHATELLGLGTAWERLITFAATTDQPLPEWMADAVIDLSRTYPNMFQVWEVAALDALADRLGIESTDPYEIADELMLSLFRRIAATEDGHERLMTLIEGGDAGRFDNVYGATVAYEYLLEHPELFGSLHDDRGPRVAEIQRLFDLASRGTNAAGMEELRSRLMVVLIEQTDDFTPDDDGELSADMRSVARELGELNYQIGRAGETGGYDPLPFLRFVGEQLVGTLPHGDKALDFIKGAEAFYEGFEPSTLYSDLASDADRRKEETLMAVNLVIAGGGEMGEQMATVALDEGDPDAVWEWLNANAGGDLSQYVTDVRSAIADGTADMTVGDG